ncbi:MAG: hypothetical protein P1R58_07275 [bacterium]|nr:hypothetical protein [bacterium]
MGRYIDLMNEPSDRLKHNVSLRRAIFCFIIGAMLTLSVILGCSDDEDELVNSPVLSPYVSLKISAVDESGSPLSDVTAVLSHDGLPTPQILRDSFNINMELFKDSIVSEFKFPDSSEYLLSIRDYLGVVRKRLVGDRDAGQQSVFWDASDLGNGIYKYKIQASRLDSTTWGLRWDPVNDSEPFPILSFQVDSPFVMIDSFPQLLPEGIGWALETDSFEVQIDDSTFDTITNFQNFELSTPPMTLYCWKAGYKSAVVPYTRTSESEVSLKIVLEKVSP